jgi:hypothetical protein
VEKRSELSIDWRRAGQAAVVGTHIDNHLRGRNQAFDDILGAEADLQNSRKEVGKALSLSHAEGKSPGLEVRNPASTCLLPQATDAVSWTRNAAL